MQSTIRNAAPQDAEILADLIRRSFRDVADRFGLTAASCPRHPSNCTADWVASDMANGKQYFLLEIASRPAGCVAIGRPTEHTAEIERLAVLPETRRHGCGSLLLNHALHYLRQLGIARAELAIIADHTDLRDWYIRRGFAVTGTRQFAHLPFAVTFMAIAL